MRIKRVDRKKKICFTECDECGTVTTNFGIIYKEINEDLRGAGWIVVNKSGEWYDFCCNKCYKDFLNK